MSSSLDCERHAAGGDDDENVMMAVSWAPSESTARLPRAIGANKTDTKCKLRAAAREQAGQSGPPSPPPQPPPPLLEFKGGQKV